MTVTMSATDNLRNDFPRRMGREDYLVWEAKQSRPHDYVNSVVYPRDGASRDHGRIQSNLVACLDKQLTDRDCDVFASKMRIWVEKCSDYYYPDVVVAWGDIQFNGDSPDTLVNPVLIIEIASQSTIGVDQVRKRRHYRTIASLVEYLLVDQNEPGIERLRRINDDSWESVEFHGMDDFIELRSVGVTLKVSDIYRRVDFNVGQPE